MQTLKNNLKNHDLIYLHYWTEPAFLYYAERYGFDFETCNIITPVSAEGFVHEVLFSRLNRKAQLVSIDKTKSILGNSSGKAAIKELEQLKGRGRVWFMVAHDPRDRRKKWFLKYLDGIGTRIEEYMQPGSFAVLYQL